MLTKHIKVAAATTFHMCFTTGQARPVNSQSDNMCRMLLAFQGSGQKCRHGYPHQQHRNPTIKGTHTSNIKWSSCGTSRGHSEAVGSGYSRYGADLLNSHHPGMAFCNTSSVSQVSLIDNCFANTTKACKNTSICCCSSSFQQQPAAEADPVCHL